MKMRHVIFLDKDGTLIEDKPYNVEPSSMRLISGAAEGLRMLHDLGYRFIVVSNQSGVARGYFSESALERVEWRLRELFANLRIPLDGFYYCPHHPHGVIPQYAITCDCRKPAPGMLFRAAREHSIDLRHSWLIGDIFDDIEAGHRAGCRSILIDCENATAETPVREPDYRVNNLQQAAKRILEENLRASGLRLTEKPSYGKVGVRK
ncbi:MAG: HAD family hydrolase [Chloroflexi bacterium]|nr:HAD family hydrolase [Chloroflexota bacterium]